MSLRAWMTKHITLQKYKWTDTKSNTFIHTWQAKSFQAFGSGQWGFPMGNLRGTEGVNVPFQMDSCTVASPPLSQILSLHS